jgi:hypothetical protein
VSEWDEDANDWSVPENMGFPYSSPANDFLLVNSSDGKYTLFASDRECSGDSVWVYVLEYDNMPIRRAMEDPKELYDLSLLEPTAAKKDSPSTDVKSEIPENMDTRRYMDKMACVRALKDSISFCEASLENLREKYSLTEVETEKQKLVVQILDNESRIPGLQERLDVAVRELQKVEMDFLFSGVVIDPDKLLVEAEREVVGEATGYVFKKMTMGEPLSLEMERIEPKYDYSFRILEEAVMAEDQSLPSGIIYQIQLFGGARKALLSELKGLSPVYEHRSPSGMYIYRVGCFSTYDEALSNVGAVRDLGFKSAYLCAFDNGKELSVSKARTAQERLKGGFALYEIRIMPESGELDQHVVDIIISSAVGKDIIRTEAEDGTQVFTVGPFDSRHEADALVETIKGIMSGNVVCELIMN